MLNVEFKNLDDNGKVKKNIIINGIHDLNSTYSEQNYVSKDDTFGYVSDKKVINILLNHSFEQISAHFSQICFYKKVKWWTDGLGIRIYTNNSYRNKAPSIEISLEVEFEKWANPWSFKEFSIEFKKALKNESNKQIEAVEYIKNKNKEPVLIVSFSTYNFSSILKPELINSLKIIESCINQTTKYLISKINKDVLTTFFVFPDDIKTVCKQYLIYFTQFLRDLGIEAETEIIDDAYKTLFKVTPKNKKESLVKIRQALNVYLKAPAINDLTVLIPTDNKDIALLQWQSNIRHLTTQLSISNSLVQMKDATIETLQLTNYELTQRLFHLETEKVSGEEIIKGIVTAKKIEGKWFTINLPEIIRRLKRKLF